MLGAPAGAGRAHPPVLDLPAVFNPPAARTFELVVNGRVVTTLTAPLTPSDNQWADLTATVALRSGTNTVGGAVRRG